MPKASTIMLGFPNGIDRGVLSGGQWRPTLPVTNLQNRHLARVARTVNASEAATRIVLDFGQPRRVRMISAIAHNMTFTAKWRIEAARTADFAAPVYDSGFVDVWAGIVGTDWSLEALEWLSDNFWLGTFNREEMEGFTSTALHLLPGNIFARYWRISFSDTKNADGYLQMGRMFIGEAWQPSLNYSWGAGIGYEDTTAIQRALGGAEFFDRREPVRLFRFTLEHMDDTQGFGRALEIVRRAGISGEVFVIPDPSDRRQGLRRNFMGRLNQISPLEQATWMNGGSAHSMAFEIKELR